MSVLVKFVWIVLVCSATAFALNDANDNNTTLRDANDSTQQIAILEQEKKDIETKLKQSTIWSIYSNYRIYLDLKKQEERIKDKIEALNKLAQRRILNKKQRQTMKKLEEEYQILQGKLQLLKEYENDPFKKFLTPPKVGDIPKVTNPVAIISALSFQEKLKNDVLEYDMRYKSIQRLMRHLKRKRAILEALTKLNPHNKSFQKELKDTLDQIHIITPVFEIFKTTRAVYMKKIDEIKANLNFDIKKEIEKATTIGIFLLVLLFAVIVIKLLVRRYMADNERFYTINKFLNILFFSLSIIILLFAYIENVNYLITILGFASAGIAIAMKDWFMSLMGWLVIILGGSVHVGDRIRVKRDGVEYVGDIIDISLLRMTLQEDITLTTYMTNRRAGRIIFVPNHYIFTDLIANYSHAGLKTVWDGIDFTITFDSNVSKATSIAKEITKKYSKGYTDITRKKLNKLRSQYSVKNTNVEPRIFSFIEPYGIKISAWYHTNAFATLTLRSTISMEIIERIQQEEDITLSYPTQAIFIDKQVPKPKPPSLFDMHQGEEA